MLHTRSDGALRDEGHSIRPRGVLLEHAVPVDRCCSRHGIVRELILDTNQELRVLQSYRIVRDSITQSGVHERTGRALISGPGKVPPASTALRAKPSGEMTWLVTGKFVTGPRT